MNQTKLFGTFIISIFAIAITSAVIGNSSVLQNTDEGDVVAGIARIWVKPKTTEGVLVNYPFALENPPITIAEGFEAYDGNLLDKPGDLHWAIDYVKNDSGKFLPFSVYASHKGVAFQGYGKTWGKFVVVRSRDEIGNGYNTLYSHLENVPIYLPYMNSDIDSSNGVEVEAMTYLGDAGKTGNTKGLNQLHFELHKVNGGANGESKNTVRIDPYGQYARLNSGLYPQPGKTLSGLEHYWNTNNPEFATSEFSNFSKSGL